MRTVFEQDPLAVLAFVAVAEHGSFRGAARELDVPKSTLSQRVAALEHRLGVQLLVRTTRSVQLTDLGASYQREVQPALEALRSAEATVALLQAKPAGRLRLTAARELGQELLPGVLATFGARYPDVTVDVDLSDRLVNLVEEGYDLALRVGPLADSALVSRRLGPPRPFGIFAGRGYLRKHGTPVTPAELADHRCLAMTGAQAPLAWSFTSGRATSTVRIRPVLSVNSYAVLVSLARADLGIIVVPESFAGGEPLRRILPEHAPPVRQPLVVYPAARRISPALRAMVDVLVSSEPHP